MIQAPDSASDLSRPMVTSPSGNGDLCNGDICNKNASVGRPLDLRQCQIQKDLRYKSDERRYGNTEQKNDLEA